MPTRTGSRGEVSICATKLSQTACRMRRRTEIDGGSFSGRTPMTKRLFPGVQEIESQRTVEEEEEDDDDDDGGCGGGEGRISPAIAGWQQACGARLVTPRSPDPNRRDA